MTVNEICFVVPNYPIKNDPMYTFVRELVVSISKLGVKCSVIAPQSITNLIFKRKRKRPFKWIDNINEHISIDIYQPIHFPFLNLKIKDYNLSGHLTSLAIKYAFYRYKLNPDILYAHFWHSGIVASEISKNKEIPVFVACGESNIWVNSLYRESRIRKAIKRVNGVICVSNKNLDESIDLGLCTKENTIVIPNAINKDLFFNKNKSKIRQKLSLQEDDFIIAFTGSFDHRKGVLRVLQAITGFSDIKALFIGSGKLEPRGENVLFSGRVPHDQVADYLNAADVFVLPTLSEGCSNAIIEAMACGLPIVSSDLPFNDGILSDDNSIRINPHNIEDIKNAIITLKNNKDKRNKLSQGAILTAKDLDINTRAKKIIKFIENYQFKE